VSFSIPFVLSVASAKSKDEPGAERSSTPPLTRLRSERTGGAITQEVQDCADVMWSDLAFVRRDPEFRKSESNACACAGLSQQQRDVRWQLQRRDGQPTTALTGPSMGLAFTLGIAKLLAAA
jgi:hypothetical protein